MADSKEAFEILEDAGGEGVAVSASQTGDALAGKLGLTAFTFQDGSGNLSVPKILAEATTATGQKFIPTLSFKDASGNLVAPETSTVGDPATGITGFAAFSFQDPSGNVTLPNTIAAGSSPSGVTGLVAFSFKDTSGNVVQPQLTSSGTTTAGAQGFTVFPFKDGSGNVAVPVVAGLGEQKVVQRIESSATSATVSLTTTPQEIFAGVARLTNRKSLWLQALSDNIKWGFTSGHQGFDLFKNQSIFLAVGDVPVYVKMNSGTGSIVVGEGA